MILLVVFDPMMLDSLSYKFQIEYSFPKLIGLVFEFGDPEVLIHAGTALNYLLPGHEVDQKIHVRLISMLLYVG